MNERLHEMMLEATKDMPQGYYVPGEYFEKFAESIVLDCLDIVDETVPGMVGVHAMEKIAKHFGVE